ncbi:dienelactone hydrolase [Fulvivirga sp. 29W222]|uniref:Dienelactone hydrolase n=1 Tax=Fulvivirga marina TaxID=2494733 RepID=A0A937KBG4_9BACT|nr:dienelactone hydrolase [Fulvivirga marina]MBL6446102.1 dienelactone hydrolase [Fulvivirga marina]
MLSLRIKNYPLVIISHGTGGGRLTLEWLATGLVKQGYVVAAVDHWGNTYDNKIPEQFLKVWERPKDISFVLSALLVDDKIGKIVNKEKIGVAGFSLGGFTAIALAGGRLDYDQLLSFMRSDKGEKEAQVPELQELSDFLHDQLFIDKIRQEYLEEQSLMDRRIKAFVAIAPALGQGFSVKSQFQEVGRPVLIMGAEGDEIAPVKTNALHYHQLIQSSTFFLHRGKVGHYAFLNQAHEPLKSESPMFFRDHNTVDRNSVHEKTVLLAEQFFSKNLNN